VAQAATPRWCCTGAGGLRGGSLREPWWSTNNRRPTSTHRSSLQCLHAVPVRPVRVTGQTGVTGKIRRETNERRQGRIPSGRHTQGCPRLGRPARMSSDIAEMKEEQHGRGRKSKGTRNKRNTIKDKFDRFDCDISSIGRGPLYL
jgi:hypothetical protein